MDPLPVPPVMRKRFTFQVSWLAGPAQPELAESKLLIDTYRFACRTDKLFQFAIDIYAMYNWVSFMGEGYIHAGDSVIN